MPDKHYFFICSLNTRCFPLHIEHIANDFDLMNSDILCLQETQTSLHPTDDMLTRNFRHISLFHLHGMFTYYRQSMSLVKTYNYATSNVESIVTILRKQTTFLTVANVYIAPHSPFAEILHFVKSLLADEAKKKKIVFADDFNLDMLQCNDVQK